MTIFPTRWALKMMPLFTQRFFFFYLFHSSGCPFYFSNNSTNGRLQQILSVSFRQLALICCCVLNSISHTALTHTHIFPFAIVDGSGPIFHWRRCRTGRHVEKYSDRGMVKAECETNQRTRSGVVSILPVYTLCGMKMDICGQSKQKFSAGLYSELRARN